MSDRRRPNAQTAGRDQIRDVHQRLDRIERLVRSLQNGQVSNGVEQLIGNGSIRLTVVRTGIAEGRQVIFENLKSGSTQIIDLP